MNCTARQLQCAPGARGARPSAAVGVRRSGGRVAFVAVRATNGSSDTAKQQQQQQQPAAVASRRQALFSAAAGAALLPQLPLLLAGPPPAFAEAAVAGGFKQLSDNILAYAFSYPVATASGQPLSLVLTHPPEKYSSAPPLSADARQRIVSELFDLRKFVTVSVTVGPASGALKDKPQDSWTAKDVALTVLIDRSTARLSSGQRTALNDIEDTRVEERDGGRFYIYEHLAQGSPTSADRSPETFRHALAVTTVRDGLDGAPFLYTLNLSCPEPLWEDMLPQFKEAIGTFRLLPTTRDYIPPDKDPWLFF